MCSLMLGELRCLGPALSHCPLHPWALGGALCFAGTSVKISLLPPFPPPPPLPVLGPHSVPGTPLGKSSEQLGKEQECPVSVLSVTCPLPLGVGSA